MADIKYKIVSFYKPTLSIEVNYYTDIIPTGLTYNLDLPFDPIEKTMPVGDALHQLIMTFAPYQQLERMEQLVQISEELDTTEIAASVVLPVIPVEITTPVTDSNTTSVDAANTQDTPTV
jgi:hypothetical protein